MDKIIGIDLGTTYSLMSFLDESGRPCLIPNSEGKMLTPSVILIKEGKIQVGEIALNQAVTEREFVIQGIKRSMGKDNFTLLGLNPAEISAEILKKLKCDAETYLNREVAAAVITVPAYFTDKPRTATKQAGELAGFSVTDLPKEPTAAALYYGLTQMENLDCILVYDLGGGTMDATVLRYKDQNFEVLASDGSQTLGGQDWTQRLVDFVSGEYENTFGVFPASDRRIEQMVISECENAKLLLTSRDTAEIVLSREGKTKVVQISLEEFEEMTADLLLQTTIKVESALEQTGLKWKNISQILLVGGSTRLRMVERMLTKISGLTPIKYRNVDQLVALGAALYTGQTITPAGKRQIAIAKKSSRDIALASPGKPGIAITLKESTTHGLGTVVIDRQAGAQRLVTSVIIKPHSPIPVSASRDNYKTAPHQTEVDIPVVQAQQDGLDPYLCHINKTYHFSGIPDRDQESQICVTFNYDKNEIIDVNAVDVLSNGNLDKQIIDFKLPDIKEIKIMLALDTSFSMEGQPIIDAKKEVKKVCMDLENSNCSMGIIQFGAAVEVVHPLTNDFNKIKEAIAPLSVGNRTPMGEGILLALEQLKNITGSRIVILVSDGFPNDESIALEAANQLKAAGINLFTISIGQEGAEFLQGIGDAYTQIESAAGISEAIGNLLRHF
jgi:molecular chaperone DnaK (HSP70)